MPRFAANLSYDPLKPLKPLSSAPNVDSTSSWQPTNNNNNSTLQSLEGKFSVELIALTPLSCRKLTATHDYRNQNCHRLSRSFFPQNALVESTCFCLPTE